LTPFIPSEESPTPKCRAFFLKSDKFFATNPAGAVFPRWNWTKLELSDSQEEA
jgi:hypothetical protein